MLRLLNTEHIRYEIKGDSPNGQTDRQTDTHAVATSVLQSQQASGIPYAIHLKKDRFYEYKRESVFYRGRVSSDTSTVFYLLGLRQTTETIEVV